MELIQIHKKIHEIRNQKVMFDFDLAELYEVETRVLKQAVKRNIERFPPDFMFELSNEEIEILVSQFVIPSRRNLGGALPFAFTEQGVSMLSVTLKSKKAISVSISIIRAFIKLKEFALNHKEMSSQIKQLEVKYDKQFEDVFEVINYLLKKEKLDKISKDRKQIGYKK